MTLSTIFKFNELTIWKYGTSSCLSICSQKSKTSLEFAAKMAPFISSWATVLAKSGDRYTSNANRRMTSLKLMIASWCVSDSIFWHRKVKPSLPMLLSWQLSRQQFNGGLAATKKTLTYDLKKAKIIYCASHKKIRN